jgi:hypothetical protein
MFRENHFFQEFSNFTKTGGTSHGIKNRRDRDYKTQKSAAAIMRTSDSARESQHAAHLPLAGCQWTK